MKKGNITGGLILILLGAWFLAIQFIPQLKDWAEGSWALSIIGVAAIFLVVSILNNIPGLSIPAFIIGGIGGLLYYQNVTGDWDSWAYAWTFIPGFVGLGLLFFSLQTRDKGTMKAGFILLFISAALFFVFGSFLGASDQLIQYWPLLLILAGVLSVLRSLFGNKRVKSVERAPTEAVPSVDGEAEEAPVEETIEEADGEENEN